MDGKVQDAINRQIRNEFYAAYLYLGMAAHLDEKNFEGFSRWMRLQAQEEVGHAMKLFDFLLERGGHVVLAQIDEPKADLGDPLSLFEQALEHEREVTSMINSLYDLAKEKNDHATQVELQWFIREQVEEENSAELAVDQLRMAADNAAALLMLDQKFGQRAPE